MLSISAYVTRRLLYPSVERHCGAGYSSEIIDFISLALHLMLESKVPEFDTQSSHLQGCDIRRSDAPA